MSRQPLIDEDNIINTNVKIRNKGAKVGRSAKMQSAGTFQLNHSEAIHRWYPYIEGYSSYFVENILEDLVDKKISTIYDPFCGTGTTPLVAAEKGYQIYYSESNPFMLFVIETKINVVKRLVDSGVGATVLQGFIDDFDNIPFQINLVPVDTMGSKNILLNVLSQVLHIKPYSRDG